MGAHHAHQLPPKHDTELVHDGRIYSTRLYPPKGASTSTAHTDELWAQFKRWLTHFWIAIALGGVAGFILGVLL